MASSSKKTTLLIYMPKKLKHIALQEIHYQLLNTCLIISSIGWRYCRCYLYQGCRERPSHRNLMGEKYLCIICQIKKTYNMDRLYNISKIEKVWKLYINLKKIYNTFSLLVRTKIFGYIIIVVVFIPRRVKKICY